MPGEESCWRSRASISGGDCGGIDGFWAAPSPVWWRLQCPPRVWFKGSLSPSTAAPALAASPCSLSTLDGPHKGRGGWHEAPAATFAHSTPQETNKQLCPAVSSIMGRVETPRWGHRACPKASSTIPRLSRMYFMKNPFAKIFSPEKLRSLRNVSNNYLLL